MAMVKGQAFSLLGCLETLGRGTAAVQWQLKEEIRQCSWRECGYWKKGPLKLKVHEFGTDRDCYMKIKATEGDEYFYLIYLVKKE